MQEYNKDPKYSYPIITWDLLPHAGASQVHPHLQMLLSPDKYPGKLEYYMYNISIILRLSSAVNFIPKLILKNWIVPHLSISYQPYYFIDLILIKG